MIIVINYNSAIIVMDIDEMERAMGGGVIFIVSYKPFNVSLLYNVKICLKIQINQMHSNWYLMGY